MDLNNKVALNFFWPKMQRQIRIVGDAARVSSNESDKYLILVTGGAGFIGSHTCLELLRRDYEIFLLDSF